MYEDFVEKKNVLILSKIEAGILYRSYSSVVTTLTELSRLETGSGQVQLSDFVEYGHVSFRVSMLGVVEIKRVTQQGVRTWHIIFGIRQ